MANQELEYQAQLQGELATLRLQVAAYEAKLNSVEPVAYLDANYGFMRCGNAADHLPIGTKLYAVPQPAPSVPEEWISVDDRLPRKELPVHIFINGSIRIAEIRWDYPGFEDTYKAYWYWDDPEDDGKEWERNDVTHWMPLPKPPVSARSE